MNYSKFHKNVIGALISMLIIFSVGLLTAGTHSEKNTRQHPGLHIDGAELNSVDSIVIGTGSIAHRDIPVRPSRQYSFTQTLYLQNELNFSNKIITAIGYHYSGSNSNVHLDIEVWMMHTTANSLTSTISMSAATKVFDGIITLDPGNEFTKVDIVPFQYNNINNLLVFVLKKNPIAYSSNDRFYSTSTEGGPNMCVGASHTTNPYNPMNLPAGSQIDARPNTKFWFTDIPANPIINITPASLDFGLVQLGQSETRQINVYNYGGGNLQITGLNFSNQTFSVNNSIFPINLGLGQGQTIDILFSPNAPQQETGQGTFITGGGTTGNNTFSLSGRGLRQGALQEGFEGELFPPLGWTVIDRNNDGKTWFRNLTTAPTGQTVPHTGIAAAGLHTYAGMPGQVSYDDWLISPELKWQTGDVFSFWIKRLAATQNNQIWRIAYSLTGPDPDAFTIIDEIIDPTNTYTQKIYDLSEYGLMDGEPYYFAFQFVGHWSWPGVIDDVIASVLNVYENDLSLFNFEVENDITYINAPLPLNISIWNKGTNHLFFGQATLEVLKVENGVETLLTDMIIPSIESGEIIELQPSVIFSEPGFFEIYARIVWPDDLNPGNNASRKIEVEAIPLSVNYKIVGNNPVSGIVQQYPVNFGDERKASLSQTLYLKGEISTGGILEKIGYYRDFVSPMSQRNIKVWIGEVAENALNDYIPVSQQTLVYDGKIDFKEGEGRTNIHFVTPYFYTGNNNLVLSVYYYQGQSFTSGCNFKYHSPVSNNFRTIYDNSTGSVNPENPSFVSITKNLPTTALFFEVGNGLGSIAGSLVYEAGGGNVADALVELSNPNYPNLSTSVLTNALGQFNFPYVIAGNNLNIKITKYGYSSIVLENIQLNVGQNLQLGQLVLAPAPQIAITGSVILSDSQLPAQNATVNLFGMDNYATQTNALGVFTINDVWGNNCYELQIQLDGYQTFIDNFCFPGVNYTIPTITILEQAPAPNVVTVIESEGNALITWYVPGQAYPMNFRYDDGILQGALITPGDPGIVVGSAWKYDALIQSVQWYNYVHPNYPPSSQIKITILGLNTNGSPNPNDVLYIKSNVANNPGWNTFVLPSTIEAPDGFFIGISGHNNFLVMAYDDGIGEPWEWAPLRQWSNGLGSYYPLENATSPPLNANILLRSAGLTYGPLEPNNLVAEFENSGIVSDFILVGFEAFESEMVESVIQKTIEENNRALLHYNIFRKKIGSSSWQQLNGAGITDTSFVDYTFGGLPYGIYHYGVEAEYSNGVFSDLSISNNIEKDMRLNFELTINNNTNIISLSEGANLTLTNLNGNPSYIYTGVAGANGVVTLNNVLKGIYQLKIIHVGFEDFTFEVDLEIEGTNYSSSVTIIERLSDPFDLAIRLEGQVVGNARFIWNQEQKFDNIESYEAFIISDIGSWKVVDQDGQPTLYPSGVTYPNMGVPSAFMVMNRAQTTPPLSQGYWGAHSGNQYFAAFGSETGTTSNWLISEEQQHSLDYVFSFYAKSVSDNYGLETFRVGYSTTTDQINQFTFITGNVSAPVHWTKFSYTIPSEAKYVTIRHNYTGLALLIDDITLGVEFDGAIPGNGFTVYLDNTLIEAGLQTNEFIFNNLVPGIYTAGVKSVYHTGVSQTVNVGFEIPSGTVVDFVVKDSNGNLINDAYLEVVQAGSIVFASYTTNGTTGTVLYPGNYTYSASKVGYGQVSGTFTVGSTALNIEIILIDSFIVTFIIENEENQPLSGAVVVFNGMNQVTPANGIVEFNSGPGTFAYAVTHPEHNRVLSEIVVNSDIEEVVTMSGLFCEEPESLSYSQNQNNISLAWEPPIIGGNGVWLHWDAAHASNSVGTGGPVDFDVAQRFAPSDLTDHNGKFLTRILFVPREQNCTYSVRVWTGGSIAGPENMVVDQVVSSPLLGQWNEIILSTPVLIDASKELWIGFRSNTATGHPAGVDAGPAIDGKGNMINLAGTGWQTLLQVAPTLNYNWSVRGLIEPTDNQATNNIFLIEKDDRGILIGELSESGNYDRTVLVEPRILTGFNVYRNGEKINPSAITGLSYHDNNLQLGSYDYFVTSLWNDGCESGPSNEVNVIIDEIACPPPVNFQVWADDDFPGLVHMVWNEQVETEFRYDDGVRTGQLGFENGTSNGVIGAAHPIASTLSQMSWLLSDEPNGGGPHLFVHIYVFGLSVTGIPNSNNLLYTTEVSNIDGIWNTYEFPEPISAPNGFFIGVAFNGFVGLGADDGIGEPYVYQNNTHYFSSNYNSGNWTPWESSGFSVNGMIRAYGVADAVMATEYQTHTYCPGIDLFYYESTLPVYSGSPSWQKARENNILGYNIYRNGTILEPLWQETTYSYTETQSGLHCYSVSAVYDECESELSNEECVDILLGTTDVKTPFNVTIYPVPARELLNILSSNPLTRVILMDAIGRRIIELDDIDKVKLSLNISGQKSGLYILMLYTENNIVTKRVIID